MSRLRLERLNAAHAVASFRSGDPDIDRYLHDLALGEQEQGLAAVHLAVDAGGKVLGFFSLSPLSLRADSRLHELLTRLAVPYPQIGGFLLGRMGVDRSSQGRGLGGELIEIAAAIVRAQIEQVGGAFLAVDPKSDALIEYYNRFGFVRIDPTGVRRRMVRSVAL